MVVNGLHRHSLRLFNAYYSCEVIKDNGRLDAMWCITVSSDVKNSSERKEKIKMWLSQWKWPSGHINLYHVFEFTASLWSDEAIEVKFLPSLHNLIGNILQFSENKMLYTELKIFTTLWYGVFCANSVPFCWPDHKYLNCSRWKSFTSLQIDWVL